MKNLFFFYNLESKFYGIRNMLKVKKKKIFLLLFMSLISFALSNL
jgi:hypothetical protein